ncbi:MAG: pilus assembly protein PilM [Phycisphaerae bacterium]|nr:pilus assembly protein PilM [Phycisphaerae bacterium]
MFGTKTSIGIDISDERINMVLLKKTANGIEFLKAASAAVPQGAIVDGNIEDVKLLAKAIKKIKKANHIHAHYTTISLVANPCLAQILDVPEKQSVSIGRFVNNQVKQYAVLPFKKTAIDFCKIKSTGLKNDRRVLVVASDSHNIVDLARALNHYTDLNVDAVEPSSISYIRACYAKKIDEKNNLNLLFAIVRGGSAEFLLFRDQTLQLVRIKNIEKENRHPDKLREWITGQINQILQYCRFQDSGKKCKNEVTIITDALGDARSEILESVAGSVGDIDLEIKTALQASSDTPIAGIAHTEQPSAIAIGLAMKFLDFSSGSININLIPDKIRQVRLAKRQMMVTANIAAMILFVMILSMSFLISKTQDVNGTIQQKKQISLEQKTHLLSNDQVLLEKEIKRVTVNLDKVNSAISGNLYLNWTDLLDKISFCVPKNVQLTELICNGDTQLLIEGNALSYKAIRTFIAQLNTSENIESASLAETNLENASENLLKYSIVCLLNSR